MSQTNELTEQKTASCLETGERLIKLLSGIINNKKAELPENTDFERLLKLAYAHRVSGMVSHGVEGCTLDASIKNKFSSELFKTAARHTAQEREVQELSIEFSKAGIEHCFLKGLKISKLYDVPEMRFMLDIDIFVGSEKFDEAVKLMENRGYEKISTDEKDCSLSKKPFLNVDLHRELKYDFDLGYEFYKDVHSRLLSVPDSAEKVMTNEELYVYLLSHTAHHFATAGTGIKSVIDHYYILKNLMPQCNTSVLEMYLEKSGLAEFNKAFTRLTKAWFMEGECDEITKQMGNYVILSGAYGTDANYYINGVLRMGLTENKTQYFFTRLFPPYKTMCFRYPVLKKCKLLLPLFWVVRIFASVFSAKRIKNEAYGFSGMDTENKQLQDKFLKNVGL